MEGKSCFTNLSDFTNEVIGLVVEGTAVDVADIDFCSFQHCSILIDKLTTYGLDK